MAFIPVFLSACRSLLCKCQHILSCFFVKGSSSACSSASCKTMPISGPGFMPSAIRVPPDSFNVFRDIHCCSDDFSNSMPTSSRRLNFSCLYQPLCAIVSAYCSFEGAETGPRRYGTPRASDKTLFRCVQRIMPVYEPLHLIGRLIVNFRPSGCFLSVLPQPYDDVKVVMPFSSVVLTAGFPTSCSGAAILSILSSSA